MEFWGVEVKPGEPLKVQPELGKLIHISQASLGEVKDVKGSKSVPLRMKIDSKEFIVGTLAAGERPQVLFDLVFEKEFELSHDCKSGSVFFLGYTCDDQFSDDEVQEFSDSDDESEDEALEVHANGDIKPKVEEIKAAKLPTPAVNANAKAEVKKEVKAEVKKEVKAEVKNEGQSDSGSSSDEDDDSDSGSDSGSDGDIPLIGEQDGDSSGDDDMSDDSDDEDSSDEELPQVQPSKKRPAQGTPIPAKKAKAATPNNKTGNQTGHTATPFPKKQGGGKFAGGNKQSPKSGGQFSGNKSFNKSNNKGGKRGGK